MMEQISGLKDLINIKVIGVGGGGNNAVNQMISEHISQVEYILVNTEKGILERSKNVTTLQIGKDCTQGLGAGANPEVGEKAAKESIEDIDKALTGTDLLFVTAGMGGGTGTGAIPVIAEQAQKRGILTIGIVTEPFLFEGKLRAGRARAGIEKLKPHVNALIVISNDQLLQTTKKGTSILEAFKIADETLKQGIEAITDLITTVGTINVDFADIRTIMGYKGFAYMGIGQANGENKLIEATQKALDNPLTQVDITGAKGVIFNVKGSEDIGLEEINRSIQLVNEKVNPEANIIFGTVINEELGDDVIVTVVATGIPEEGQGNVTK